MRNVIKYVGTLCANPFVGGQLVTFGFYSTPFSARPHLLIAQQPKSHFKFSH